MAAYFPRAVTYIGTDTSNSVTPGSTADMGRLFTRVMAGHASTSTPFLWNTKRKRESPEIMSLKMPRFDWTFSLPFSRQGHSGAGSCLVAPRTR